MIPEDSTSGEKVAEKRDGVPLPALILETLLVESVEDFVFRGSLFAKMHINLPSYY